MAVIDTVVQACQAIWLPWILSYRLVMSYGCHEYYCTGLLSDMVAIDTRVRLVKPYGCHGYGTNLSRLCYRLVKAYGCHEYYGKAC